jgi:hypothetical protein
MPRYGDHLALRAHETGYGPVVTSERYDAVKMRLAFQGRQARRDHGPDLEAVGGGGQARTDAEVAWIPDHGTRRSAHRQSARRAGGALERDQAIFQLVNATLTACFSKKLNCATKTVDTKVVGETSLYNFCKGRPMFFSTV